MEILRKCGTPDIELRIPSSNLGASPSYIDIKGRSRLGLRGRLELSPGLSDALRQCLFSKSVTDYEAKSKSMIDGCTKAPVGGDDIGSAPKRLQTYYAKDGAAAVSPQRSGPLSTTTALSDILDENSPRYTKAPASTAVKLNISSIDFMLTIGVGSGWRQSG